ncbi:hypothetical protein DSM3645_03603 [Blastopirellula marina DSM 3645]|uniref:Uncharacterized protein n=1 Tax=Blastopirellula marina DSM 3645 TaxID=314230 RepID=A3ZV42_9BACT|nr:hypothetical protein DSM3645_03603 [Blastopirellula marina DSM 3645]
MNALFGRARLHEFDNVADRVIHVRSGQVRLSFFAVRKHVHHQGRNPILVPLNDPPTFFDQIDVGPFDSFFD